MIMRVTVTECFAIHTIDSDIQKKDISILMETNHTLGWEKLSVLQMIYPGPLWVAYFAGV